MSYNCFLSLASLYFIGMMVVFKKNPMFMLPIYFKPLQDINLENSNVAFSFSKMKHIYTN